MSQKATSKMSPFELKSILALSSIMSLRMLGLFMILPLFAAYVQDLANSTPLLIGLALGVYGLTQGLFQIPFGALSDHFGRRPIILAGLCLFIAGSVLAAFAANIYLMLFARALQGAGAIGSTIIATIADLTREDQRTKAMAINGITIGFSFMLAMMLGPAIASIISVKNIFWVASAFGLLGILILFFLVPTPTKISFHADVEAEPRQFFSILTDPQLLRLNSSVFFLHAIFTATFVALPLSLLHDAGITNTNLWKLFVPALIVAFLFSFSCIYRAEKKHQLKKYFLGGILIISLAEYLFATHSSNPWFSFISLTLFFSGFSLLEAFLPSWVSRVAPRTRKGTALGIYSSSQFLGIFAGGSIGGLLFGEFGLQQVYLFCVAFTLVWLLIAFGMKSPQYSSTPQPVSQ